MAGGQRRGRRLPLHHPDLAPDHELDRSPSTWTSTASSTSSPRWCPGRSRRSWRASSAGGWRRAGRSARRSGRWPAWRSRGLLPPVPRPTRPACVGGHGVRLPGGGVRAGPGLEPGDRELAAGSPGAPRHVLSVAVVGALLITAVSPASLMLGDLPDRFTAEVASAAEVPASGTRRAELPVLMADTQAVVGAVGPDAVVRLHQPAALVYYLLGLESPARYFHVSMAIRAPNQADLIDELKPTPRSWSSTGRPPRPVALGRRPQPGAPLRREPVRARALSALGVGARSALLPPQRHRPPDLASLAAEVSVAPRPGTWPARSCRATLGTAPAFLDSAGQVGTDGVTLDVEPVVAQATYIGWSRPSTGRCRRGSWPWPPDGTVLRGPADLPRPDLAANAPESTASGFSLVVPLVAGETMEGVHLVAVTPQGTAAAVGPSPPLGAGTRVRYSGGREARPSAPPPRG